LTSSIVSVASRILGAVNLVRSYANIADELDVAGYSLAEIEVLKKTIDWYLKLRETIRNASGETLDLKSYEADMRMLIDMFIEADRPRTISPFQDLSLLELIIKTGIADAINSQLGGLRGNKEAIAETIENNVRRKIIKEHLNDPAYFEKMSKLLDELIKARKEKAIAYEEYLKRIAALAQKVEVGVEDDTPKTLDTPAKRALYNNLQKVHNPVNQVADIENSYNDQDVVLELALKIDAVIKAVRPDGWRGIIPRENVIKEALYSVLEDVDVVEKIFLIIKEQKEY